MAEKAEKSETKSHFCSNCGAKLAEGAKFCPKCGQPVGVKAGASADQATKPTRPKWVRGVLLLALLLLPIGWGMFATTDPLLVNPKQALGQMLAYQFLLYGCATAALILAVRRVLKNYHRVRAIIWIIFIIGTVIGIQWPVSGLTRYYLHRRANLIRDSLTDTFVAKQLGDEAVKQGLPLGPAVQKAKASSNLIAKTKPVSPLFEYHYSAGKWANTLADAKDAKAWQNAGAEPATFTADLSDSDAEEFLLESINHLADIKSFGDAAIARDDREAMRYIAARLSAEKHWLDGMENSPAKTSFSGGKVYAAGGPKRTICVKGKDSKETICISDVQKFVVGPLIRSAYNYLAAAPDSAKEWKTTGDEAASTVGKVAEPAPLEASVEPSVPGQVPKDVNEFWQECKDAGGKADNELAKDRLPTGEGGYTCGYQNAGGDQCWDYLTYSGRDYSGGEGTCDSQNLLYPTSIGAESKGPFDGSYTVQYSAPSCDGEGYPYDALQPVGNEFVVSESQFNFNNEVVYISEDGTASYFASTSADGADLSSSLSLEFTENGTVSGKWDASIFRLGTLGSIASGAPNRNIAVVCSGTFSGQRQ